MVKKIILQIPGMDCAAEEALVKQKFSSLAEITSLEFNLLDQQLTIIHNLPNDELVIKALQEIGMQPKNIDECCSVDHAKNELLPSTDKPYKAWGLLAISGIMAFSAEIISFKTNSESSSLVIALALVAILLSGRETIKKGLIAVRNFTININFLMVIAITGAALIGEWPEAAMITVLFAVAEMIEKYSLDRARNAIRSLIEITPESANVKNKQGEWEEQTIDSIEVEQIIWVKPGERIPLDGVIINGSTSVNQAPITGESMPVSKSVGDQVFAGSINEQGSFEFKVTTRANNTTIARIARAIKQAQSERTTTERFVDQFAKYYTPIMVVLAILIAAIPPLFYDTAFLPWLYKSLVLLVIACPCALVVSTPVTVVSGLASAAKHGVLIKGGTYLELGRKLKALALDKTGTLTEGKPTVTDIVSINGVDEKEILFLAASLDSHSEHPIAEAVVASWRKKDDKTPLLEINEFSAIIGKGVRGIMQGERYYIGNHRLIEEKGLCSTEVEAILERLEHEGKTTLILFNEKQAIGILAVADSLRENTHNVISELKALAVNPIMLTGDNPVTAATIAKKVGISEIYASLLPEDKLTEVNKLLAKYKTVGMVGDGINDAPALAKASIGFAMGAAGTATALETADIALMKDNLEKIPYFINLSKKTYQVLVQNISLSISTKLVFFILALLGKATLWMAVFADMGTSLIVVLNGLRLLKFNDIKK
ncbi:MAG: heavy metal translocating P-type ATPase [Sphingobacteriia bacterium]|nr:heavy metal translocating P-type ATPase [Sphingobacteriia bacterium]